MSEATVSKTLDYLTSALEGLGGKHQNCDPRLTILGTPEDPRRTGRSVRELDNWKEPEEKKDCLSVVGGKFPEGDLKCVGINIPALNFYKLYFGNITVAFVMKIENVEGGMLPNELVPIEIRTTTSKIQLRLKRNNEGVSVGFVTLHKKFVDPTNCVGPGCRASDGSPKRNFEVRLMRVMVLAYSKSDMMKIEDSIKKSMGEEFPVERYGFVIKRGSVVVGKNTFATTIPSHEISARCDKSFEGSLRKFYRDQPTGWAPWLCPIDPKAFEEEGNE